MQKVAGGRLKELGSARLHGFHGRLGVDSKDEVELSRESINIVPSEKVVETDVLDLFSSSSVLESPPAQPCQDFLSTNSRSFLFISNVTLLKYRIILKTN